MQPASFRPFLILGAFATVPFLFGADGKGCQPPPASPDGGALPTEDGGQGAGDAASPPDAASTPDASATVDAGACVSRAGGPCGGFTQDPCSCAPGLACKMNRIPDVPGVCVATADAACVDNALCIRGDHWDPAECKCVPDADAAAESDARFCVDNVFCVRGDHWDSVQCKCVPTAAACNVASDCHGVLPQLCVQTCDGGPGACAHFSCQGGVCETVLCE